MMATTLEKPASSRGSIAPGAPPAFETVFEDHGAEIYRYLRRFATGSTEAADLHQEVFLRAFRAYGRLTDDANVRAWLYRIAGNLAVDAHRKRSLSIEGDERPTERAATVGDPEASARASELRADVRSALLNLSPSQRLAVCGRVLDGAQYAEVAHLLGCSETAARQHVSQGLRRLRAALKEWR